MNFALISDIHIRLSSREEEYKQVFERLYAALRNEKPDRIVILGDLFHNKTNLSPESITMAPQFLKNLTDIAFVDIIAGNHDIGKVYTRMDSIEPIINLLSETNLVHGIAYYKKSGVFNISDDHKYVVFDFRDKEFVKYEKQDGITAIGLYHGAPYSMNVNGITLESKMNGTLFDDLDYLFCGDIHHMQYFNPDHSFVMVGSLIQQSFGETLSGHGYHIYDTESKIYKFNEIENEFAFVTITDNDLEIIDENTVILKNKVLRSQVSPRPQLSGNYTATQLTSIQSEIRKAYGKTISIYMDADIKQAIKDFDVMNISDVNIQNSLIKEYCEKNKITNIDELIRINTQINNELKVTDSAYYIKWRPLSMTWKNMFSFGEEEATFDFNKLTGVTGILGANTHGKSNIFHILLFALFGNTPKISKIADALNTRKNEGFVELTLQVENETFRIERTLTRKKKTVASTLKFEKLDVNTGKYIPMDGDTSTDTKKIISKYIGEYEDIITSTFALQGDDSSVLKKGESERKEFVYNYIGLNIFEKLYKASSPYESSYDSVIKSRQSVNYEAVEKMYREFMEGYEKKINLHKEENKNSEEKLPKIDESIIEYNNKLNLLNEKKGAISERNTIEAEITSLKEKQSMIEAQLKRDKATLDSHEKTLIEMKKRNISDEINDLNTESTNLDLNKSELKEKQVELEKKCTILESDMAGNDEVKSKLDTINKKIDELGFRIKTFKRQTEVLEEQPWMRTNERCSSCILAKEAFEADSNLEHNLEIQGKAETFRSKLENDYNPNISKELMDIQKQISSKKVEIANIDKSVSDISTKIESLKNFEIKLNSLEREITTLKEKIHDNIDKYKLLKDRVTELSLKSIELEKLNEDIQLISQYEDRINQLKSLKESLQDKIKKNNEDISLLSKDLGFSAEKIEDLKKQKAEYEQAVTMQKLFKKYREIVHRNGLPLDTLKRFIPMLNTKINSYLSDLVKFRVKFEIEDDKMKILIFNSTDNVRDIRAASGLEVTLTSWIIRACLSEFSILPKCDVFIIDEGFGSSDQENLSNMDILFDKLKQKFSKIFIISHIPQIADFCDNLITVVKNDDDYSYLK
jgi:DNA repair exonuclease SbcCD ATPase subunit